MSVRLSGRKCRACKRSLSPKDYEGDVVKITKEGNAYAIYLCDDCHNSDAKDREPIVVRSKCAKCGEIKSSSEFSPRHDSWIGLQTYCKRCVVKNSKKYETREYRAQKIKRAAKKDSE
jgi:hypothetical protein